MSFLRNTRRPVPLGHPTHSPPSGQSGHKKTPVQPRPSLYCLPATLGIRPTRLTRSRVAAVISCHLSAPFQVTGATPAWNVVRTFAWIPSAWITLSPALCTNFSFCLLVFQILVSLTTYLVRLHLPSLETLYGLMVIAFFFFLAQPWSRETFPRYKKTDSK